MHSTRAVRSIKKLFEGYHEPTLSKQQSQKLLDDLKASFRGNLDREYGHSPRSIQAASKADDAAKPTTTRRSAGHQHLKDILSNPMLHYNRNHPSGSSSAVIPATSSARDPMDVFDHAVSRGMMTVRAATGILQAKRQQMQNGSASQSDAARADVSLRVVRWLRSSEHATSLSFLESPQFVKALMPFLVMEDMETTVWGWFADVVKKVHNNDGEIKEQVRSVSSLLRELVVFKAGSQEINKMDEAITSLLQANESLPSDTLRDWVLPRAWRSISWLATVDNFKTTAASETLFDAHIATSERFARRVDVETAHLYLYHPTHPSCTPALDLFKQTFLVRYLAKDKEPLQARSASIPPWIVVLAHDTMNFLLRAGRNQEAVHLARLLKSGLSSIFLRPDSASTYLREAPGWTPA